MPNHQPTVAKAVTLHAYGCTGCGHHGQQSLCFKQAHIENNPAVCLAAQLAQLSRSVRDT